MPDSGTGRTDFPKGSSSDLYESIHNKIYELGDNFDVYVGHDYQPGGRELRFKSSLKKQKEENYLLKKGDKLDHFKHKRDTRDEELNAPKLLLPSIQVNINAGIIPKLDSESRPYLYIPVGE